ncbi:hypothetical protein [Secundilactobacillus similis]|uniref:Uncharacterized protein n=1 Tax=Secundilactobacillus similis DSM 23365 = JCM 2765 TaxID=1423804 RepID=A0A0R2ESY4_9LACO|nr:hypothetical protein [Secundilactobacillus similis]KRN15517.1 hypothetical protein FD14_GL002857 [Secundilactobacillus similis DSM 23365 = JCM 2765]
MIKTRPTEEDTKRIKYLCALRKRVVESGAKMYCLSHSGTQQDKLTALLTQGVLAGEITATARDMTNGMEQYQRRELIELLATLFDRKKWFDE